LSRGSGGIGVYLVLKGIFNVRHILNIVKSGLFHRRLLGHGNGANEVNISIAEEASAMRDTDSGERNSA
jgi:hypothetical protein